MTTWEIHVIWIDVLSTHPIMWHNFYRPGFVTVKGDKPGQN